MTALDLHAVVFGVLECDALDVPVVGIIGEIHAA